MNRKSFYKEQAEQFMDFKKKFTDRDLLSLFEEWCESKDFSEEDKEEIFKEIVRLPPKNKQIYVTKVKVHMKKDPILLKDVIKIIIQAIELADKEEKKTKEEEKDLDNEGKL